MSDTESHQASIDASEASIPAGNGPREVRSTQSTDSLFNRASEGTVMFFKRVLEGKGRQRILELS